MKSNIKTIRSQVLQPASAGNGADLVNCKLITADPRSVNRASGAVWLSYGQINLWLQELTQLSADFRFPDIFYYWSQFPANTRSPPADVRG